MSVDKHWVKTMFKEYVKAQKKWVKESGIKLNDKVVIVHPVSAEQLTDFPLSFHTHKLGVFVVRKDRVADGLIRAITEYPIDMKATHRVVGISPYGIRVMQMGKRVDVPLFDVPFFCLARVI